MTFIEFFAGIGGMRRDRENFRLLDVGNGITVNVVEAIGKRLKEIECNH